MFERVNMSVTEHAFFNIWGLDYSEKKCAKSIFDLVSSNDLKSKFYKKRGATFFYDITRKLGPLDFTQYRSKSSSF